MPRTGENGVKKINLQHKISPEIFKIYPSNRRMTVEEAVRSAIAHFKMDGFSKEFVKSTADELGISNFDDDVLKYITDDLSFKTSLLLYQAVKLMKCCKRKKLIPSDVEASMKLYNVQPTYGFRGKDWIPFRRAGTTSAGRDIITTDDKDIDLDDFVAQEVPKLPPNISLKAHWLSINGIQPRIPENPQQLSDDADIAHLAVPPRVILDAKSMAFADVTVEQQVYFKEATEACVSADENRRKEALASLSSDPGIQPLVPRLVAFLSEGVKLNVAQQNYVQLIYLMRMLRSLVENPNLSVDSYVHELLPACASCCMSKLLCQRPKEDNHWALRTFAARQLAYLVRKYTTETNQVHARIVRLAVRVLQDSSSSLVSCFGSVAILGELGDEVVRSALLPYLRSFGERVRQAEDAAHHQNPLEQLTIKKILEQIQMVVCPAVKNIMQPPDHMSEYQTKFGYFAHVILTGVMKERQTSQPQGHTAATTPYAQQLQQYQSQKQQQQRRPSTSAVLQTPQQPQPQKVATPQQTLSVSVSGGGGGGGAVVKGEPVTPIIFGPPPGSFHASANHPVSLPTARARSPTPMMVTTPTTPGLLVGGTRIQSVARVPGPPGVNPVQQVQTHATPSNSPGPQGPGQQFTVRILSASQQQQPPKH